MLLALSLESVVLVQQPNSTDGRTTTCHRKEIVFVPRLNRPISPEQLTPIHLQMRLPNPPLLRLMALPLHRDPGPPEKHYSIHGSP